MDWKRFGWILLLVVIGVAVVAVVGTASYRLGYARAVAEAPQSGFTPRGMFGRGISPHLPRVERMPAAQYPGGWPDIAPHWRGAVGPLDFGGIVGTFGLLLLAALAGGGLVAALISRRAPSAVPNPTPAPEPAGEKRARNR